MPQRSLEIKSTEMMIIKAKHDYCQFFHKLKNHCFKSVFYHKLS